MFGGYVSDFKHYELKISKFLSFNYEVNYLSSINKVVPYDSIEFIVRDDKINVITRYQYFTLFST